MGTHEKFTRVNEKEEIYERQRVTLKVERGSTFTFTRDLPYIVSIIINVRKIYVRAHVKITRWRKSTFRESSLYSFKHASYLTEINIVCTYPIKRIIQHVLDALQRTIYERCQHGDVIWTPCVTRLDSHVYVIWRQ